MAQRDLTYNTPQVNVTDNNRPLSELHSQNPFVNPTEEDESSSFDDHSYSQSDDERYGRPFASYNGYYSQNGTNSNLLSQQSLNDEIFGHAAPGAGGSATTGFGNNRYNVVSQTSNTLAPENSINAPPAYDRYPSMGNSRVVSSTSLASASNNNSQNSSPGTGAMGAAGAGAGAALLSKEDDSSLTDPFLNKADFSPFGGYPAQLFPLHIDEKEPDDYLHNPDPIADAQYDKNRFMYDLKHLDKRSFGGLAGIVGLFIIAVVIFVILPVLTYSGVTSPYKPESYELLSDYSYPLLSGIRTDLVDPDTPDEHKTIKTSTGDEWKLVFSDEFNAEGRTFYEDDDQFFYAPDFHYDATHDLEWYDPDAVTTANGTLQLRMDAIKNHDLFYRSGMMHSWNKLCFSQGLILISAQLPFYGNISGLWPGLWTMGNLGRPGYMASTEGVWPYTYDACDAGITANQSSPDGISYLPGQKLASCVCPGEDHPNTGTGRGAPEIDIIEGEVDTTKYQGIASQSYQIAPMDIWYYPDYNFIQIHNPDITTMNTYTGGPFQQAVSGTTTLSTDWYEKGGGSFQQYGFEWTSHNEDGYLTWYVGTPTVTVKAKALGPNGNVGWRRLSKEPMAIVMNFGISNNWAYIDWNALVFPMTMRVDNVRIYQPEDEISITCDPDDHPTTDYINDHKNAYYNYNLTSWDDAGYSYPKNKLVHGC